jgi:hypothetical protein
MVQRRSSAESKTSCGPQDLLIGEGATIDGSVLAQNVTVCGHVKAVEGDIFHRSLSIESSTHRHRSTRIRDLCE